VKDPSNVYLNTSRKVTGQTKREYNTLKQVYSWLQRQGWYWFKREWTTGVPPDMVG